MDANVSERSIKTKYKPLKLGGYQPPSSNNLATQLKNVNVQIKVDSTLNTPTADQAIDIKMMNSKSHKNMGNPVLANKLNANLRNVNETPFMSENPNPENRAVIGRSAAMNVMDN